MQGASRMTDLPDDLGVAPVAGALIGEEVLVEELDLLGDVEGEGPSPSVLVGMHTPGFFGVPAAQRGKRPNDVHAALMRGTAREEPHQVSGVTHEEQPRRRRTLPLQQAVMISRIAMFAHMRHLLGKRLLTSMSKEALEGLLRVMRLLESDLDQGVLLGRRPEARAPEYCPPGRGQSSPGSSPWAPLGGGRQQHRCTTHGRSHPAPQKIPLARVTAAAFGRRLSRTLLHNSSASQRIGCGSPSCHRTVGDSNFLTRRVEFRELN